MNLTQHDIDWIVAEVVRRLKNLSGGRQATDPTPISDKVVTLETLRKYQQQAELVVLSRAIVTPAARDELKKRNIRLVRDGESRPDNNKQTKVTENKILVANIG